MDDNTLDVYTLYVFPICKIETKYKSHNIPINICKELTFDKIIQNNKVYKIVIKQNRTVYEITQTNKYINKLLDKTE